MEKRKYMKFARLPIDFPFILLLILVALSLIICTRSIEVLADYHGDLDFS